MSDNRCGTCIGGEQMFMGIYGRCMDCKGTGVCEHVFDKVEFSGEQWDDKGERRVPTEKHVRCANCGAFQCTTLNNDGSVRGEPYVDARNWHP